MEQHLVWPQYTLHLWACYHKGAFLGHEITGPYLRATRGTGWQGKGRTCGIISWDDLPGKLQEMVAWSECCQVEPYPGHNNLERRWGMKEPGSGPPQPACLPGSHLTLLALRNENTVWKTKVWQWGDTQELWSWLQKQAVAEIQAVPAACGQQTQLSRVWIQLSLSKHAHLKRGTANLVDLMGHLCSQTPREAAVLLQSMQSVILSHTTFSQDWEDKKKKNQQEQKHRQVFCLPAACHCASRCRVWREGFIRLSCQTWLGCFFQV